MSLHPRLFAASAAVVLGLCAASVAAQQPAAQGPPAPRGDFLWFQFIGPTDGGRISAISGVPGDNNTWYIGNASGGIFKTTNNGATNVPVFDETGVQAIGALAVSQSNHDIVWAGTGEAWVIRDADIIGDGVYKSTDAGRTWKNM